ncbi:hypothetical protein ACS0VI_28240 [Streptomyces sp. H28]|uniref:hypothetical protein n=1 Tax=Streptomyces sp. H28 TaxID=2775865 RepID=UPI003EC73F3F
MTRAPAARAVLVSALSVTALLTATACSAEDGTAARSAVSAPASTPASAASPAAEQPSPTGSAEASVLSAEQVRAALVTETDLGEPWIPTRGAATWRDGLLKATAQDADCRRLLDALYTEDLFGDPTGPHAVVTLDDAYSDAQLRYQVAAHPSAEVDRTLDWMASLPGTCARFTATATGAGRQEARVEELPLPEVGDARAALRITLSGRTPDGADSHLTVDLAAVRVGEDTITLTNGGLGEVLPEITRAVAQFGTERLTEIRRQSRLRV